MDSSLPQENTANLGRLDQGDRHQGHQGSALRNTAWKAPFAFDRTPRQRQDALVASDGPYDPTRSSSIQIGPGTRPGNFITEALRAATDPDGSYRLYNIEGGALGSFQELHEDKSMRFRFFDKNSVGANNGHRNYFAGGFANKPFVGPFAAAGQTPFQQSLQAPGDRAWQINAPHSTTGRHPAVGFQCTPGMRGGSHSTSEFPRGTLTGPNRLDARPRNGGPNYNYNYNYKNPQLSMDRRLHPNHHHNVVGNTVSGDPHLAPLQNSFERQAPVPTGYRNNSQLATSGMRGGGNFASQSPRYPGAPRGSARVDDERRNGSSRLRQRRATLGSFRNNQNSTLNDFWGNVKSNDESPTATCTDDDDVVFLTDSPEINGPVPKQSYTQTPVVYQAPSNPYFPQQQQSRAPGDRAALNKPSHVSRSLLRSGEFVTPTSRKRKRSVVVPEDSAQGRSTTHRERKIKEERKPNIGAKVSTPKPEPEIVTISSDSDDDTTPFNAQNRTTRPFRKGTALAEEPEVITLSSDSDSEQNTFTPNKVSQQHVKLLRTKFESPARSELGEAQGSPEAQVRPLSRNSFPPKKNSNGGDNSLLNYFKPEFPQAITGHRMTTSASPATPNRSEDAESHPDSPAEGSSPEDVTPSPTPVFRNQRDLLKEISDEIGFVIPRRQIFPPEEDPLAGLLSLDVYAPSPEVSGNTTSPLKSHRRSDDVAPSGMCPEAARQEDVGNKENLDPTDEAEDPAPVNEPEETPRHQEFKAPARQRRPPSRTHNPESHLRRFERKSMEPRRDAKVEDVVARRQDRDRSPGAPLWRQPVAYSSDDEDSANRRSGVRFIRDLMSAAARTDCASLPPQEFSLPADFHAPPTGVVDRDRQPDDENRQPEATRAKEQPKVSGRQRRQPSKTCNPERAALRRFSPDAPSRVKRLPTKSLNPEGAKAPAKPRRKSSLSVREKFDFSVGRSLSEEELQKAGLKDGCDAEVFYVHRILNVDEKGKYHILWLGWNPTCATLENAEQCAASNALAQYELKEAGLKAIMELMRSSDVYKGTIFDRPALKVWDQAEWMKDDQFATKVKYPRNREYLGYWWFKRYEVEWLQIIDPKADFVSAPLYVECWIDAKDTGLPADFEYALENVVEPEAAKFIEDQRRIQKCHKDCKCRVEASRCLECISQTQDTIVVKLELGGHSVSGMQPKAVGAKRALFLCDEKCNCPEDKKIRLPEVRKDPFVVFRDPHKGWTLRTLVDLPQGRIVAEYFGELKTGASARGKDASYQFECDDAEGRDLVIDARLKGNEARFASHSCDPNMTVVCGYTTSQADGFHRLLYVTLKEIKKGEELTLDYHPLHPTTNEKDPRHNNGKKRPKVFGRCMCMAAFCRGWL